MIRANESLKNCNKKVIFDTEKTQKKFIVLSILFELAKFVAFGQKPTS